MKRALRRLLGSAALVGCAALGPMAGCETQIDDRDVEIMPLATAKRLWDRNPDGAGNAVGLLDARSPTAFAEGHIPGARRVQLDDFDPERRRDPALTRFDTLVVYGRNPGDAAARSVTKRMLAAKYDDVWLFAGGIEEWLRAGYPTTPPVPPP